MTENMFDLFTGHKPQNICAHSADIWSIPTTIIWLNTFFVDLMSGGCSRWCCIAFNRRHQTFKFNNLAEIYFGYCSLMRTRNQSPRNRSNISYKFTSSRSTINSKRNEKSISQIHTAIREKFQYKKCNFSFDIKVNWNHMLSLSGRMMETSMLLCYVHAHASPAGSRYQTNRKFVKWKSKIENRLNQTAGCNQFEPNSVSWVILRWKKKNKKKTLDL